MSGRHTCERALTARSRRSSRRSSGLRWSQARAILSACAGVRRFTFDNRAEQLDGAEVVFEGINVEEDGGEPNTRVTVGRAATFEGQRSLVGFYGVLELAQIAVGTREANEPDGFLSYLVRTDSTPNDNNIARRWLSRHETRDRVRVRGG